MMTQEQRNLLLDWMRKIHQLEYAHAYESLKWSKREKIIGISAFIISTLIACSYRFPHLKPEVFEKIPYVCRHDFIIPLASTILAILTGLHTFLKPGEKSENHRKSGLAYEKLRHKIEPNFFRHFTQWEIEQQIESIRKEWEKMDNTYVSPKNFQMGKSRVKSLGKYPEELGFLPNRN